MRSLNSVGISLSLVFGCLLLALIAELYYLLWWKKRICNRDIEEDCINPTRDEFFYMPCFKKPQSLSSIALNPQEPQQVQVQAQLYPNNDFWLKPFGEEGNVDAELLTLAGPPRFLFTINEETKEDLESEDAKSTSRSMSDILVNIETPFLTPLASPSCFTPPLTPIDTSNGHNRFSPLFKSASDAEFNRVSSSPPPKFKFMRDAEDKLHRKVLIQESEFGSFKSSIGCKNKLSLSQPSSSSQVLPVAASPPTFRQFFDQPNLN